MVGGITKQLLYVGHETLGTVIIILHNICTDITVDVGEMSCGIDEIEGVVYGGTVS